MLPYFNSQHLLERSFSGHLDSTGAPPIPPARQQESPVLVFPFQYYPNISHEDLQDLLAVSPFIAPSPLPPLHDPMSAGKQMAISTPPPLPPLAAAGRRGHDTAVTSWKKASRKDRHSKIVTAQGPRDRRMRLSLGVAQRFFDLQDALGFDKPSKTVHWLLDKAKRAIRDINPLTSKHKTRTLSSSSCRSPPKSESSTSECEDGSTVSDHKGKSVAAPTTGDMGNTHNKAKRNARPASRRTAYPPEQARESRAKARARARERTQEKKRIQCNDSKPPYNPSSSSVYLDGFEDESGSYELKSSLELVRPDVEEPTRSPPSPVQLKPAVIERAYHCLSMAGESAPPITNMEYHQNIIDTCSSAGLFQEQWDMHFSGSIDDERLLLSQIHASKSWESNNNMSPFI